MTFLEHSVSSAYLHLIFQGRLQFSPEGRLARGTEPWLWNESGDIAVLFRPSELGLLLVALREETIAEGRAGYVELTGGREMDA